MYYIKITKICHIKYYTKIDRLNILTSQRFFNGLNKKNCGYAIRTSRVCGQNVLKYDDLIVSYIDNVHILKYN